jgi:uncharacterized protein
MLYFDPTYYLFVLPGLGLALLAQLLVWLNYSKYSGVSADSGLTGLEAANKIARGEGFDVEIQLTPGKLNDYFNPVNNVVNLSADNQTSTSVANIAVVAHEFGHVQQKYHAFFLFGIRTGMVPAVNIGSTVGYLLFIVGIFLNFSGLITLGLILFSLTTIFTFITLPIEFDASRRGMALIRKYNLIAEDKLGGARGVLMAAALTYVAALVQSLGQLLYFISIANRRR